MALHLQQQVLDALKAVLIAADTDAGDDVFVDRVDPLRAGKLPVIVIEEGENGETAEPYTLHGLEERTLQVVVHCLLKHHTNAAADVRALGLVVEKAISPATSLSAICKLGWRMTNSRLIPNGQGEELLAERVQTWEFKYLVNPATPDVVA